MNDKNQIKKLLSSQMTSEDETGQFLRQWDEWEKEQDELADMGICPHCKFGTLWCDCSRYDSEGNEL